MVTHYYIVYFLHLIIVKQSRTPHVIQRRLGMFLDKLWVRLKGQILCLKEDLYDSNLREEAESLLEKVERRIGFEKYDTDQRDLDERLSAAQEKIRSAKGPEDLLGSQASGSALSELRQSLERLEAKKKQKQDDTEKTDPVNPRVLG